MYKLGYKRPEDAEWQTFGIQFESKASLIRAIFNLPIGHKYRILSGDDVLFHWAGDVFGWLYVFYKSYPDEKTPFDSLKTAIEHVLNKSENTYTDFDDYVIANAETGMVVFEWKYGIDY